MNTKKFVSPEIENSTIEELTRQLLKANNELKHLQEEREMMFANISHDLRAPMTAIRSALDLFFSEEDPSGEEMRKTLELINRRAKTLEALVNDMYYLYKVSSGTKRSEFEEIEAIPFLEEYYFDLQINAKYDNFKLELEIEPDSECLLNVDVQEMVRVLDNLYSNAARYSGEGSVITLKAGKSVDGKNLNIIIKDNGCGIPEEKLPYIFMRTYTVSDSRTPASNDQGSGLGLAIVKSIVEKHGGTITCESKPGVGTEFLICLPISLSS